MTWQRIDAIPPPVGRPLWVRTAESDGAVVAFLGSDDVWYEGGALVQSAATLLAATPVEWCEPDGRERL
jgi:hypothetical protein